MIEFFIAGLLLGISAGISPGPLMAVLISETIKGNFKNGFIISIVPVLTDIPLIIVLVFFLKNVQNHEFIIKTLYFLGFIVLTYYGLKDILASKVDININSYTVASLKRGLLTNILNPHPYIFWGLVGVPFIIEENIFNMISFIAGFFIGIVGSKISIALIVEKSKKFLQSRYYIYMIKLSGLILVLFGVVLFSKIF